MPRMVLASVFASVLSMTPVVFADDGADNVVFSRPALSISQEGTRITKGGSYINVGGNLNDDWFLPTNGSVDFQVKKNERLGLEVMLNATYFAAADQYADRANYVRNIIVTAPRLDASYIFGDMQHPSLKADFGIFNYKYDEYARNLGEYMFRTWAYPGIIQTGGTYGYVGNNSATVTGLKLSQSFGMFSHEFLASIETEITPVYDLNLTYMARFKYRNILKVGGGVQLARILTADRSSTRTSYLTAHYFQHNGTWYAAGTQGSSYYSSLQTAIKKKLAAPGVSHADSIRLSGELAQDSVAISVLADTSIVNNVKMKEITAKAIKPVFYFSFDPKPFIGSNLFGPNDLVIYGEAAILGTQSYPVYYKDVWQRIPVMLGFNIPTFKVLDVLSVEGEYYGSRWMPTYQSTAGLNYNSEPAPIMDDIAGPYYPTDWNKDNWKWSVYAERSIIQGVTISAQAASDHSRTWDFVTAGRTPWEMYTTPSQWYWALKLGVKI